MPIDTMRFTLTHDLARAQADLRAFGKQAQFAAIVALTRTAQDGKAAEGREIERAIDRPTPYTRNAVYMRMATRARPEAEFGLKDDLTYSAPGHQPTNYLRPQIEGGQRNVKGFEKLLTMAGHMPAGWQAVPGKGARLDAYGNLSRGQIIQILSQLRVTLVAGFTRNMSFDARKQITAQRKAGGRFFVVKPGGKKQPGIYQREFIGRNVAPVVIFVQRTGYRRRLDWQSVADRTVEERLDYHMAAALDHALATARP